MSLTHVEGSSMARLTKSDAARQLGISRTTLYKLIDQGRVSATPDGLIDETELVRAAPYVDSLKERSRTSMDKADMDMHSSPDEHRERPPEPVHEQPWTPVHERQWTFTDPLVDVLREQLQRAQERERVYEERERAYHDHIARLTAMLHEAQQQNQRLLDMPRSVPAPAHPGPRAAVIDEAPRGEIRRRIVALLREHPDGVSPAQVRQSLGLEKYLGSTMKVMARDGLLRRVAMGRYVVA
jgi:excisionase family DNA binding protein